MANEIPNDDIFSLSLPPRGLKLLSDVISVVQIKVLFLLRGWYWYLIRPLVFPVGVFYWLRSVAPDDPEVVLRVMTGVIVFGVSLLTANMLAQQMIQDRFLGRLRLLITMPVSKIAYALGVLVFAMMQSAPVVALLLLFAKLSGVEMDITWGFLALIVPLLFSLAGVTFLIASYAPSMEIGSIMANLVGGVFVIVSPVFFTTEDAPLLLRWLGWVSPMRYAADGIEKSLSGNYDIWLEFTVVAGFAVGTMALGLWKLKWRES